MTANTGSPQGIAVIGAGMASGPHLRALAEIGGTAKCKPQDVREAGRTASFLADMDKMHLIDPADGRVVPVDSDSVVEASFSDSRGDVSGA